MKKSEVIKLMKEGTHCIYNDCPEKLNVLAMIFSQIRCENVAVSGIYQYYWIEDDKIMHFSDIIPEHLGIIYLSKIEPDNENPYLFYEGEKYYFGEEYEFRDSESEDWVKCTLILFDTTKKNPFNWAYIRKIDHTEKLDIKGVIKRIAEYSPDEIDLMPFDETRKKDHIYCIEWGMQKAKRNEFLVYQKLLLELKEQAEKDGVNLKELI